jgi:hypothetical protein
VESVLGEKNGNRTDLHRSDSLESRSRLTDYVGRAPIGITEHAESLYLKPVHRDVRQAGDGDRLLDRGCRNRRPRAGSRSVHYRITDEIRLFNKERFASIYREPLRGTLNIC